jgi:hypothetical protein
VGPTMVIILGKEFSTETTCIFKIDIVF